jgi:peroxiredoxin
MINTLKQTISLGPVNLPLIIIPLLLAWIIYQLIIKRFYKSRNDWLQKVDRIMFNALFVILIVWKLSPLLLQFSTVINNPLAALYLPGGLPGVLLGFAAAISYCIFNIRKQKEEKRAFIKSLGLNLAILLILFIVMSLGTAFISERLQLQTGPPAAAAGSEAPGFSLEGEDAKLYKLSDYAGKTIVINFWASWCPPCRAELPELKKFYEEADSGEIVFLSINLLSSEREPENLPAFIKAEDLSFPVLYDRTGEVAEDYNVESIPTTLVIGSDGRISAVKSGAVTNAWLKRAVDR